jgi:low affinity Fe/Cu permease
MGESGMNEIFRKFAVFISNIVGSVWAFLAVIIAVAASGYYFGFSDRWKANTGFAVAVISLSILIFLQRSQNHNDKATHIKLDELINAVDGARDEAASIEDRPEKDLNYLKKTNPAEDKTL